MAAPNFAADLLRAPPIRSPDAGRAADEAMEIYRLTAWVAMGDDARTVTHTQLSWTCVCAGGPAVRRMGSEVTHNLTRKRDHRRGPGAAVPGGAAAFLFPSSNPTGNRRSDPPPTAPGLAPSTNQTTHQRSGGQPHGRARSRDIPSRDPRTPLRPEARPRDQRARGPDLRDDELRLRRRRARRAAVRAPGIREHLHPDHEPDDRRLRAARGRARGWRRGARPRVAARPPRRSRSSTSPAPATTSFLVVAVRRHVQPVHPHPAEDRHHHDLRRRLRPVGLRSRDR